MPLELQVAQSVHAVPAQVWDELGGADQPATRHAFFAALEDSGSAVAETGWQTCHHVLREDGHIVGIVPAYAKAHSQGEFVFDHGWAQAWQRAGGRYYPKLLVGVPFTPVPGPRLLTRREDVRALLPRLLRQTAAPLSSAHANFLTATDAESFTRDGWIPRIGFQFHWTNRGYRTFAEFLGDLSSKRRKDARRERHGAQNAGLRLADLDGNAITPPIWRQFHELYARNSENHWGHAYLTPAFFEQIGATMPTEVILSAAFDGERLVAGALHLAGREALFGRQWGASVEVPFLHFELCYYRAIDLAIERGLPRVEAGAQGEHKLQRGYLPTLTHSAHFIRDERFRAAVADACARESDEMERITAGYAGHSPFRADLA